MVFDAILIHIPTDEMLRVSFNTQNIKCVHINVSYHCNFTHSFSKELINYWYNMVLLLR